jgi:hypothetical protein
MPQIIIDLDDAAPEDVGVKLGGKIYALPGDIEIPTLLKIERLMTQLGDPEADEAAAADQGGAFLELYDEVLDLFRIREPDLEELRIGARQLGQLVVRLYTAAADQDESQAGGGRPPKAGTRSTKPRRRKASRGSKS